MHVDAHVPEHDPYAGGGHLHAVQHEGQRDEQRWRVAVLKVQVAPEPVPTLFSQVPLLVGLVLAVPYVVFLFAVGTLQSHLSDDQSPYRKRLGL